MASSSTPLTETSAFTANVYPPQANSGITSNDVAAPLQALANRTLYLNNKTGTIYEYTFDSDAAPPTWELVTATGAGFVGSPYGETFDLVIGTAYVEVPACVVGDLLDISVHGSASWAPNSPGNWSLLRAIVTEDYGGSPAVSNVDAAKALVGAPDVLQSFALAGTFTVATAGVARVSIQGAIIEAADELKILSSLRIQVRKYRA
jgi:hypothetical protein